MVELSDIQRSAVREVDKAFRRSRRVVLALPTGAGKTRIAAHYTREALIRGDRVLFIAPWRVLVPQTMEAFSSARIDAGVIMAGVKPRRSLPVQIASWESLTRRVLPPADLVIIDEAHRALSDGREGLLAQFARARHLLLTATPWSASRGGLAPIADELVVGATVAEMIRRGLLEKPIVYGADPEEFAAIPVDPKTRDYRTGALEKVVRRPTMVGDIVAEYSRLARTRKGVVFGASVAHSKELCAAFKAAGYRAAHIDAGTPWPQRKVILDDLRRGRVQIVTNCGCLTEGFNEPSISAVVLRPTKSLALYLQMVGRGLRTSPGKHDCIVIDPGGCAARFGLPTSEIRMSLTAAASPAGASDESKTVRYCSKCRAALAGGRRCECQGGAPRRKGPFFVNGRLYLVDEIDLERVVREQARSTGYGAIWEVEELRRLGVEPSSGALERAEQEVNRRASTMELGQTWARREAARLREGT